MKKKQRATFVARIWHILGLFGMFLMLGIFFLYVLNLLPSKLSARRTAKNWELSVEDFYKNNEIQYNSDIFLSITDGAGLSLFSLAFFAYATFLILLFLTISWLLDREFFLASSALGTAIILLYATVGFP